MSSHTLQVLDQLLIVLMLFEILHTVRISIRSHTRGTEPFLVVGLIASIRRILVITLEAADLTKEGKMELGRGGHLSAFDGRAWPACRTDFDSHILHNLVAAQHSGR